LSLGKELVMCRREWAELFVLFKPIRSLAKRDVRSFKNSCYPGVRVFGRRTACKINRFKYTKKKKKKKAGTEEHPSGHQARPTI